MSKSDNLTDFLTDVADAIRTKEGSSGTINPQDFSTRIANLQSGYQYQPNLSIGGSRTRSRRSGR